MKTCFNKKWTKEQIKIRAISIAYAVMEQAALMFYALATAYPLIAFGYNNFAVICAANSFVAFWWLSIQWFKQPYREYRQDSKLDVPHCGKPHNPNLESDKQKHARGQRQAHDIIQITSVWAVSMIVITLCFIPQFFLNVFPE